MVSVAAVYGFVGVLLGDRLPQLSRATAAGLPLRLIQAMVVFGLIGLAFVYLGLGALGVIRDPFAHRPVARVVVLGALKHMVLERRWAVLRHDVLRAYRAGKRAAPLLAVYWERHLERPLEDVRAQYGIEPLA